MLRNISKKLDLMAGLKLIASNDLLPPREDDKVSGEVGKRFVEYLYKQIEEGHYEPNAASFVQVPKPGLTSRPAALLTLTDRVVYESIVELLRPRLAKYLLDSEVVFWPRESYCNKRWEDFENSPLKANKPYIVHSDVSGFYESIDHIQLEDDLVQATGERNIAHSLQLFLSRIMGSRRGLPQGLMPSDTLATTYLQQVDAAMLREGFDYWRHGDDIRVAVESMSRAREAIAIIEEELRRRGLLLNSSKVFIQPRDKYEECLKAGDKSIEQVRSLLYKKNIDEVVSDQDKLIAAMKDAQLDDQWGWNLFYHGNVSIEEVIEQIRGQLEPTDVLVAEHAFSMAVKHAPGRPNSLPKDLFHFLITRSLIKLAAARSLTALPHAASVMARFPEKTEIVCQYLQAIMKSNSKDAIQQIENLLSTSLFTTPWQQAWFFRVLGSGAAHISAQTLNLLQRIASSQSAHWLSRVEAMKVLAWTNKLERELLTNSWKLAPRQYRCDLIVAAAILQNTVEWAQKFLKAAKLDPVEQVVVFHLQSK